MASLWLPWTEIERLSDPSSGWLLFGVAYAAGLGFFSFVHVSLGRRFRGSGMRHLRKLQVAGLVAAALAIGWKRSGASPRQLLVLYGVLGGGLLFTTVWFAWFLLRRGTPRVRQGLLAMLIAGGMVAVLIASILLATWVSGSLGR